MPQTDLTQEEFRAIIEKDLEHRNGLTGTITAMLPFSLVRADADKAMLILRAIPDPWTRNQNSVLHGGIVATLLDSAMGVMCRCFSGDRSTPTVSMTVNYAAPVPIATPLNFTVELEHMGSTMMYVRARCMAETRPDRVLASAQGVYYRA